MKSDEALQPEVLVHLALAVEGRRANLVHRELALLAVRADLALWIDAVSIHCPREEGRAHRIRECTSAGRTRRRNRAHSRARRGRRRGRFRLVLFASKESERREEKECDAPENTPDPFLKHGRCHTADYDRNPPYFFS